MAGLRGLPGLSRNAVKKIQSTAKTQTNEILTPEQIATWEAMKEAAKEEE